VLFALLATVIVGVVLYAPSTFATIFISVCVALAAILFASWYFLKPPSHEPRIVTEIDEDLQTQLRSDLIEGRFSRFEHVLPIPPNGQPVYQVLLHDRNTKKNEITFYFIQNGLAVFVELYGDLHDHIEAQPRQLLPEEIGAAAGGGSWGGLPEAIPRKPMGLK
jgi:hypothetical protein